MKAEILLQAFISQGDIQDVNANLETNRKAIVDPKTFFRLHLDRQYRHTAVYL